MKKAALYIRVSTLEQAQEGYSIGAQKERLTAFCKAHDWLIADYYIDGGYSGSNLDRPGIQKLCAEVESFDLVLVWKLDRLSRSQRDTLYLIEEVFLPADVDFVSMSESFDTSTPFGRAMIGILSVFAQLEREQIKERTFMGRVERAKAGMFHGGVNFPIGYDYGPDGRLVVNEYEAAQVRKIYALYLDGNSPDRIAEILRDEGYTNRYGSWSVKSGGVSVLRVLTSEVYLGTIRFGGAVTENAHPALVDRETFDKVAAIRKKRHERFGDSAYKAKYLLVGLCWCAHCGARYAVKHNYKDYKYYECYSRMRTVKRMIKADSCKNKNWRMDELDSRIEAEISRLLFEPGFYEKLKARKKAAVDDAVPAEADVIRSKVADLDRQIGRLMDLYQDERMPVDVVSSRIDKLHREKTALEEQLASIVPPKPPRDYDDDAFAGLLEDFAAVWKGADLEERREIVTTLIKKITLDDESVEIEWAFLDD